MLVATEGSGLVGRGSAGFVHDPLQFGDLGDEVVSMTPVGLGSANMDHILEEEKIWEKRVSKKLF